MQDYGNGAGVALWWHSGQLDMEGTFMGNGKPLGLYSRFLSAFDARGLVHGIAWQGSGLKVLGLAIFVNLLGVEMSDSYCHFWRVDIPSYFLGVVCSLVYSTQFTSSENSVL